MKKKLLKDEIIRCGRDPEYFIRKYVKIQHPVRGLISFDLFDYQTDLLSKFLKVRFNIINKARQLGITEVTAAYATWMMLFRRDKNIVVIATKKDTAKELIRRIHTAIDNLPQWLMLTKVKTDNVYSMEFSNGSRIKAVSTAKDAGRSEAGSLLIIDEAAHIETMEKIWIGLKPIVTAGGNVIMMSTPNGVGNTFHSIWVGAIKGENDFVTTELMWWLHPEHVVDEKGDLDLIDDPERPGKKTSSWFRKETAGSSDRMIAQEYECNFNASGDTFISNDILQWMEDKTIVQPFKRENWDRNLFTWNEYVHGQTYMIVGDVARGDGTDYSAAHAFEVTSMLQVCEYKGKIPPDQFADVLLRMGRNYGNALIVFENNSVGLACWEHIRAFEYENVYFSRKGDFKPGKSFNASLPLPDMSEFVPGFTTSSRTRPLILQKFEESVRTHQICIRSERLLDELRKFIWNNGRPQAARGYNDDLVMSAAMACWIRDTFFSPGFLTADINKKMLNMTSYESTNHTQIPGAAKDPRFVQKTGGLPMNSRRPYDIALPDGTIMNIGWLISSK